MSGGKPVRILPYRPVFTRKIVLMRSIFMFTASILFCCWVGTKMGSLVALLVLAVFWLSGALNLLDHLFRFAYMTGDEAVYHDMLKRADIMQQPNVQKVSDSGESEWLSFGISCMQGWRRTMEDDHVTLLTEDGGFFGVFDGHSGSNVAKFCGGNIFDFIKNTTAFKQGNYSKALYDGFIAIDRHLHVNHSNEKSGCTAVVLFVKGDVLYCGNAGDSRSILCRDGEPIPLSIDHKPFLPGEQSRIERAGGYVWNRRVNGALALSRAIGDFSFKCNTRISWDQQAVTSAPEVRCSRLDRDRDEFAVIACDGIWDVLSNEQVVEFVRLRIHRRVSLDKIAEELLERCLSPQPFGIGCDNMSVVIVQFKRCVPNQSPSIAKQEPESHAGGDFSGADEVLLVSHAGREGETWSDCRADNEISAAPGIEDASMKRSPLQQQQRQHLRYGDVTLADLLDYSTTNAELLLLRDTKFVTHNSDEPISLQKEKEE